MGERWEFPGGKCEFGESPREALVREWKEETGLDIQAGEKLAEVGFSHKGKNYTLLAFAVLLPEGPVQPALREHDQWSWVVPDEIPNMHIVDSDRTLFERLRTLGVV